jgi:hypothetical protein
MTTVTIQLSAKQARLVEVAVEAEIRKGSSTFLSGRDVVDLGRVRDQIRTQIARDPAGLMSRIETAVEDYSDACDYTNSKQLTAEDIDYLASELQINTRELTSLLNLELV